MTKVSRDVICSSWGPDSSNDLVNSDMHRVGRQLLPRNATGGIDHEDRMAVHGAHIHATGKSKDTKAGAEHVIAVFQDGESKMELGC